MISIKNLHKAFDGKQVMDGVTFDVQLHGFTALIGMSGTGKSVLLKHIAGMITPDSGSVEVDGVNVHKASGRELEALRGRFGFVFQHGALFDSLTVFDNVAFPLREKLKLADKEIEDRVMAALSGVGLTGAEGKYPAEISGGMIKRTSLARAMICDPELIFFDEPTTGLDPIIARTILKLFQSCHQTKPFTGIIVSHDIPEVFEIVDTVVMLYDGRVHFQGTPDELMNSDDAVIRQFTSGSTEGPIQYI